MKTMLKVQKARVRERALLVSRKLEKWRYGNDLTLPDFLGIGVEKCGTTWLHEVLLRHPQVFIPESKEIDYFSRGLTHSLRWYGDLFKDAIKRRKGEISPGYSHLSHRRIRLIKSLMPNVRLILLLRNPIDRAWSHAFHELVKGRQQEVDQVPEAEFLDLLGSPHFQKMGDYPEILGRWLDVFPKEQLFVGLYDDLAESPRGLLAKVFEHVGVTSVVDWATFPYDRVIVPPAGREYAGYDPGRGVVKDQHVNSTAFMPARVRAYLLKLYGADIVTLERDYALPVGRWAG